MRKILLGLALALVTVCGLRADFTMNPQNGVWFGFPLSNQAGIGENSPGSQYCTDSILATPLVNVVVGEPLVYVDSSTYLSAVSGTTTANDVNFAGFAITSAFATSSTCPTSVYVCRSGVINTIAVPKTALTIGEPVALSGVTTTASFNNSYTSFGTLGCAFGNITATSNYNCVSGVATPATYTSQTFGFAVGHSLTHAASSNITTTVSIRFPY
jgi:hypothetical protein